MSKIEQIITEIEEYIDNCRFQPLSNTKIVVNKEEIDELLAELRLKTPDEIKKYFPRSFTPSQMKDTILKLLDNWLKNRTKKRNTERS